MGLFGLLGVASNGIAAQSAGLSTTGQNIANVSTPGYVRRTALLETADGGGVRFTRNERTFDRFAYAQVLDQQGRYSAADTRGSALTEIETILAPPTGSIGDESIRLVQSFNALAAFPTDQSLRADVVNKSQNLAGTLSAAAKSLEATGESLLGRAKDTIDSINKSLKTIADLNTQVATALGSGGDPSGLRDQRDLAIRDVAERLGARAIEGKDGRVTLFAAGAVLVEGDHASPMSMDLDANGAMRFWVSGATKNDVTSRVDTGSLGGLREARDVDLAKAKADVDAYAYDVANAFNAIHSAGYGADGVTGRDLFVAPTQVKGAAAAMALNPLIAGRPDRIAAAGSPAELPGGNTTALKLGALASAPAIGGSTLADRFAAMAMDVGLRKQAATAELDLRTDTLAVAQQVSDSANGVSLDEEMVNLSRFQRAFEASSKVMRTADECLRTLMESV